MNDLQLIKEEIYNCGYVPKLLESLGCDINFGTSSDDRIEARRPDGSNRRSVQVYLDERLTSRVRTKAHIPIRDIYDIVSYIRFNQSEIVGLNKYLPKSRKYIIDTLGLTQFSAKGGKQREDPNAWLKKIQRKKKQRINLDEIEPNPTLPKSIMDGFVIAPYYYWYKEGISLSVQREFEVGFDIMSERVIFPIYDRDQSLVGVKGRATKESDMKDYKYMPIYNFQKSKILYNLHRALPYIQDEKEVIFVEGEKSVMKLWGYGYKNVVSQMGSEITRVQAEIAKRIIPNLKIVLAFDKDKSPKEVMEMSRVFGKYDNLYGIIDTKNFLDNHESPCDKGLDVWENLYNSHCYLINKKG